VPVGAGSGADRPRRHAPRRERGIVHDRRIPSRNPDPRPSAPPPRPRRRCGSMVAMQCGEVRGERAESRRPVEQDRLRLSLGSADLGLADRGRHVVALRGLRIVGGGRGSVADVERGRPQTRRCRLLTVPPATSAPDAARSPGDQSPSVQIEICVATEARPARHAADGNVRAGDSTGFPGREGTPEASAAASPPRRSFPWPS